MDNLAAVQANQSTPPTSQQNLRAGYRPRLRDTKRIARKVVPAAVVATASVIIIWRLVRSSSLKPGRISDKEACTELFKNLFKNAEENEEACADQATDIVAQCTENFANDPQKAITFLKENPKLTIDKIIEFFAAVQVVGRCAPDRVWELLIKIYRPLTNPSQDISEEQQRAILNDYKNKTPCYFHATYFIDIVCDILSSGHINVANGKVYPGAFVSTEPETELFGPFVFAFTRELELHSPLLTLWDLGYRYWAGFWEPIPVLKYLEGIYLVKGGAFQRRKDAEVEFVNEKTFKEIEKKIGDKVKIDWLPSLDSNSELYKKGFYRPNKEKVVLKSWLASSLGAVCKVNKKGGSFEVSEIEKYEKDGSLLTDLSGNQLFNLGT